MSATTASLKPAASHRAAGRAPAIAPSRHSVIAGALAIAILLIDTFTPYDIAVAVLYVAVVLMSIDARSRHGIVIATLACVSLTVASFIITHGGSGDGEAVGRALVSLAAIAITAFLALRIRSATAGLRERADLLDLTHDGVFARNMDGVVTYWNRGAEELYGWSRAEAIGKH